MLTDLFYRRQPGPLGPCAQRFGCLFLGLHLQGLTEQAGLFQHALALLAIGLLVMLVPGV